MNTPYPDERDLEKGGSFVAPAQRSQSLFKSEVSDEAEIRQPKHRSFIKLTAEENNVPRIRLSSRASFDSQNFPGTAPHIDLWISTKLQELGIQVSAKTVKRTIRAYPEETSRDFILEAILQNFYEGDPDEESESDNVSSPKISLGEYAPPPVRRHPDTPRYSVIRFDDDEEEYPYPSSSRRGGNASPSSNLNNTFFCNVCDSRKPGEFNKFKAFICQHTICYDCGYKILQSKKLKDEDISTLKCPTCQAKMLLEKFCEIVPEADQLDLGDEEIGDCAICFDTIKGSKEALQIFKCNEHFYCYQCTKLHIKEHIDNLKVLKLQCPEAGCSGTVDEDKMKKIIPKHMFEKYWRFKKNMLVDRNPNRKWCTRAGCEEFIEKGDKPKVVCKCGQETCFDCGSQWHKGQTCEKALEKQYKFYAKEKDIHFCPECKSRIEKAEGCNHMTCLICTYEWCWLCKGEYSRNHYDPFNPLGCPGLMSGHNTRQKWSKLKIYGYRFLIFLGILVAIATFPAWIIIVAIIAPNLLWEPRYDRSKCTVFILRTILFIIGFILFPVTLALGAVAAVVPGTCYLGAYIYNFFKEKFEAKRRRKRLIKERLGRGKPEDDVSIVISIQGDDLYPPPQRPLLLD